jgi:ssDNA-binding Zn-finger/Zn-ribbon topoisomerase 1
MNEDLDKRSKELCDLNVCLSRGEARRVIVSGKYEKYKAIGLKIQKERMEEIEKEGTTIWPCPQCGDGKLITRSNKKTGESFLGCTNFPECKYTQKPEKIETLGIKDAAEVWE